MEKQVNLSIDMDGVLAKFNENLQAEERLYEKGYFLNLEPQRNVVRALYDVCFLDWDEDISIRPRILSAFLTESKYALDEKKAWLKREVPALSKNYTFCDCGQSKSSFIASAEAELASRDILIDDYGVNCKNWKEAGGVYVKVSRNRKDARQVRTRHKFVFSPDMSPAEIANVIKKAIKESTEKRGGTN